MAAAAVANPSQSRSPPARPNALHKRSNFDDEPNPFEQSFATPRQTSSNVRGASPKAESLGPSSNETNNGAGSSKSKSTSPRPVLPPLASISSPADVSYSSWPGMPPALANSLRSGPLSPAMLTGPQDNSTAQNGPANPPHLTDFANFRTGLTPRGTGLTPRTGLTPLVGGPVSFPPASPGTAAFFASFAGTTPGSTAATITPNTLNAISGVLNGTTYQQPTADQKVVSPTSSTNPSYPQGVTSPMSAQASATNGLFLLSQAHHELTKREAEQAQQRASLDRANGVPPNGVAVPQQVSVDPAPHPAKRGTKRKGSENVQQQLAPPAARGTKRTRTNSTAKRGKQPMSDDDDDDDADGDDIDDEEFKMTQQPSLGRTRTTSTTNAGGRGNKKPETEEEKRRNFLERNRQAALKCRQRKKQWLADLQANVEFLSQENERLKSALVSSREEISRLSAMIPQGAAVVGVPGVVPQGVPGVHPAHHHPHPGMQGPQASQPGNGPAPGGGAQQPISMSVSVGKGQGGQGAGQQGQQPQTAKVGGYGY